MKMIKKSLIALLILSTVNFFILNATFAESSFTKHPLEIRSTPQEEIPKIKVKEGSGWTWVLVLGLIGGVAAALSGGGDGDGPANGDDTGSGTINW